MSPTAADSGEYLVGGVSGTVGDEEDLQAVLRVLERGQVGQLGRQVPLLVVRRDDQRDRRERARVRVDAAPRPEPGRGRCEEEHGRIEQIRVGHEEKQAQKISGSAMASALRLLGPAAK